MPDQKSDVIEIFAACLDVPEGQWREHLAGLVGPESDKFKEVWSLLHAHRAGGMSFLSIPAVRGDLAGSISFRGLPPGHQIGDFVIIRELGHGSYATVYLAAQYSLGRNVAIKLASYPGEEARVLASLEHPNIVQVHAATPLPDGSGSLLCMQYVPGITVESLLQALRERPFWDGAMVLEIIDAAIDATQVYGLINDSERQAFKQYSAYQVVVHLACSLASALAGAHAKGILHLDVKPANIMIDINGRLMLADFNVALQMSKQRRGAVGGTFKYMAPEHQAAFAGGDPALVDQRADLYSFGIILGELLELLPEAAPDLAYVYRKCTEANRSERPADAGVAGAICANHGWLADTSRATLVEQDWFLYRAGSRRPALTLWAVMAIPNLLASVIQIAYNKVYILEGLTVDQRTLFSQMLLPLNIVVYGIASWIFYKAYAPLFRQKREGTLCLEPARRDFIRSMLLRRHLMAFFFISLGWGVSCLAFTLSLHYLRGPLPMHSWLHFIVSFSLAAAIPLTYSALAIYYLNIIVYYPTYLYGMVGLHGVIAQEMELRPRVVRVFRFLAGAVPLLGATFLIMQGPSTLERYKEFAFLVIAFIVTALGGFLLTERLTDRIYRGITLLKSGGF